MCGINLIAAKPTLILKAIQLAPALILTGQTALARAMALSIKLGRKPQIFRIAPRLIKQLATVLAIRANQFAATA